ncbi:MAG TPA: DUF4199 domain-containing protein [Gammaproteobacteria bacterium]|jgi:hypothetical protein|nr:DUF4199 domain-containing protein [Gammaproteobacteria bacterium]
MIRLILRYGIIGGLIVGVPLYAMTLTPSIQPGGAWGYVVGYLTMLIGLSTIFIAIKKHRDTDLGGVIKFWPALGLGLGISFVAGIIYMLAWEAVLDFTHFDFAGTYAQSMIDAAKAKDLSGAELVKIVAQAQEFKTEYANPSIRLTETFMEIFPVGVLISLVSAALLRNARFFAVKRAG